VMTTHNLRRPSGSPTEVVFMDGGRITERTPAANSYAADAR